MGGLGLVSCRRVLLVLNAIFISVFLNKLVIFLMWDVVYVKVAHFVPFFFFGVAGCESCWHGLSFSFCRMLIGKLLLYAICLMDSHSFCSCVWLSGSEYILSRWNL